MDQLRLFVSLRALNEGAPDSFVEALQTVGAEVTRLEREMAGEGGVIEPFSREDLDHLFLLKMRQSLEPEGKILRWAPLRWYYGLTRRLLFGTQRRYNESVTSLMRRLYATSLLTRYYQLRSLALERRLNEIQERLARLESNSDRLARHRPSPPETGP